MIDIATANTETIGKKAALTVTAATVEKVRKFYNYCYGCNADRDILARLTRYFINLLDNRFQNGDMLHSALPETATTDYDDEDIYIIGFFVGYLAGAQDMEALLNEIELPANADE